MFYSSVIFTLLVVAQQGGCSFFPDHKATVKIISGFPSSHFIHELPHFDHNKNFPDDFVTFGHQKQVNFIEPSVRVIGNMENDFVHRENLGRIQISPQSFQSTKIVSFNGNNNEFIHSKFLDSPKFAKRHSILFHKLFANKHNF